MSGPLDIDPRSLMVLHLVARSGSMSAAARELSWTHAAVSQHIARLQRRLGVTLVERHARGVRLTPDGEVVANHAAAIADTLAAVASSVEQVRRAHQSQVTVAAFPTACATFLVDVSAQLSTRAESVRLKIIEAEPPEAQQLLLDGAVDLAVTFDTRPQTGLTSTSLGVDEIVGVLPESCAADVVDSVGLEDLVAADHGLVIAGCRTCRDTFTRYAHAHGVIPCLHHQITDDYILMQAMVAAGQATAVLPHLAVHAHRRTDVVLAALTPALTRTVFLLASQHRQLSAAATAARTCIAQAARTYLAHGGESTNTSANLL